MKLINKFNFQLPKQSEKFIVHTESNIYAEAHVLEEQAFKACTFMNDHNIKNGHPERFTYSLKETVKIIKDQNLLRQRV